MSEMKKAGDILKTYFDRSVLAEGEKYLRFFSAWDQIVGPDISSHAKAVDIVHSSVLVEVDHPGWLQMLQMRERSVIQMLHQRFPELKITGIRYRLVDSGAFSPPGSQQELEPPSHPAGPADTPASPDIKEALNGIHDQALRAKLKRLGDALGVSEE